ncbi:splicing regulator RBM11 isoform X2 [Microcaecilia unicolor]|nr:splicing regulator RBM11 isoform X2 [Microcaecilia unicolor]
MFRTQDEMDRTIFVGNLDNDVKEEILYELFLQAGPLIKVSIAKDKEGNPKSFGFVCFKHTESVPYAIALLNGIRLYGRPIKIDYRSGSSHTAESSSPYQGVENNSNRNTTAYRNDGPMDQCLFPTSPSTVDNGYFSEACFYFQGMMNYFVAQQQFPAYSQVAQPSTYFQDIPQQSVPLIPFPSLGQHVMPGSSCLEWASQKQTNTELYQNVGRTCKRKRQQLTSDSDSSTERKRGMSQTERGHNYRHCQTKKTKFS